MFKIVQELRGLNSRRLEGIAAAFLHLSRSIDGLAREAKNSELANAAMERRKITERDKRRLQKLRYQRAIMTRYMAGQSYEQIAAAMSCHPKTIYKHIRKIQIDLAILKDIDTDVLKAKVKAANKMTASGYEKKVIVRRLNISAHYVPETKDTINSISGLQP